MSATSLNDAVESIQNQISDDIGAEQIEEELAEVRDYGIPMDEAVRTVASRHTDDFDGSVDDGAPERVDAASIDSDDEWVTLNGEVVDLWDSDSDAVAQTGLIVDNSGSIKFTLWAKSADSLPTLEEGQSYRFESVVTDEFNGRYSVNLNSASEVTPVDKSFESPSNTSSITGAIVAVKEGSGLISRCPEDDCTRVLRKGRCQDHGAVDGEDDLRVKAVLDDGTSTEDLIFDEEMTEAITGVSIDEARQIAAEALNRDVVGEKFEEMLVGQYVSVNVEQVYNLKIVQGISELDDPADPGKVLLRGRSMTVSENPAAES